MMRMRTCASQQVVPTVTAVPNILSPIGLSHVAVIAAFSCKKSSGLVYQLASRSVYDWYDTADAPDDLYVIIDTSIGAHA